MEGIMIMRVIGAIISDVVDSADEGRADFLSFHYLGSELGTLLGVLQDGGDLDGAGPVAVVEALGVDQFLQVPFLELALVAVDHFVVVGDDAALGGLLAYDVEIVVLADDLRIHESTRGDVSGFALGEESFTVSEVDHDEGHLHLRTVFLIDSLLESFGKVVDDEVDLVSGNSEHEDDEFLWWGLVSGGVSFDALHSDFEHRLVFVIVGICFEGGGADEGEGRVDGAAASHHIDSL